MRSSWLKRFGFGAVRPIRRQSLAVDRLEDRATPATAVWTGNVDASWNNFANWQALAVPIAGDDVVFNNANLTGAMVTATNMDIPGGLSLVGLSFAGATSFTVNVTNTGLNLSGDLTDTSAAVDVVSGLAFNFTGAPSRILGSGSLTFSSPVTTTGTLGKINNGGTATFSTSLAVTGNLYVSGGAVTFDNAAIVTTTGVIGIGANDFFIAGGNAGSGGTVNVNGTASVTVPFISMGENNGGPTQTNFLNQSGGTVTVTSNSGENAGIRLGHWGNETSTYNLSGGALVLTDPNADLAIATDGMGVFNMTGGTANTPGVVVNHRNAGGTATFTQSGGTYTVGARGFVVAANSATLSGTASMTVAGSVGVGRYGAGGTLNVQDTATLGIAGELNVGDANAIPGNVNQTGGTVTVSNRVRLAHWPANVSTYTKSSGALNVTNALNVGWDGVGVFSQTGGTINAGQVFVDGNGNTGAIAGQDDSFTISGGSLTTSTFAVRGGSATMNGTAIVQVNGSVGVGQVAASTLIIGGTAQVTMTSEFLIGDANGVVGMVTQSGGTVQVNNRVRLAHWPANVSTYTKSAGSLSVTNALNVGWDGIGVFNQTGGTATVGSVEVDANAVTGAIAGQDDLFSVNGGTFTVGGGTGSINVRAGGVSFGGTGTVNAGYIGIGIAANSTAAVSGTALVNTQNFWLGEQSGFSGTMTQTGGTINASNQIRVGHWPNAVSVWDMSGGALNVTAAASGTNPFGGGEQPGAIYLGVDGTGQFNHSGGTISTPALVLDNRGDTAGTDHYKLTGPGTLTVGTWGIQANASTAIELGGGGTVRASATWATSRPILLTGTGASAVIFDTNGNNITLSGVLSGAGGFVKDGAGTLLLNAANNFTGNVVVNAGTAQIGASTAFGAYNTAFTKVTVNSGGAVNFNGIIDAVYGYTISGAGVGGTGALVNNAAAIGTGNAQASNIRLAANAAIGGTGNWALLTFGYAPTTLDLAGFTLTKLGSNTFTLANATVTAGAIDIQAGVVTQIANNKPAGHDLSGVAVSLANVAGAALNLNNLNLSVGSLAGGGTTGGNVNLGSGTLTVGALNTTTTYSGIISGTGGVTKVGTGALTLAGLNTFGGNVLVSAGLLIAGASNTGAGALGAFNAAPTKVVVQSGATLDINGRASGGGLDFLYGVTIAGTGTSGQGALVNNGASGATTQRQTPNITLSGNATVGGTGDILMINGGYAADTLNLNGNTLTKIGSNRFVLVTTTVTAGTIQVNGGTLAQSSGFGGASNLSAATVILANTAGAQLDLGGFDMQLASLSGGGAAGGNVLLGTRTLTINDPASATYAGAMSGAGGALVKNGAGTLTLSGTSSYTGATTVSAGRLDVTGTLSGTSAVNVNAGTLGGTGTINGAAPVNVASGARIDPGVTTGTLSTGPALFAAGSFFDVTLAGTGVGQADRLSVTGTPNLGNATLNLTVGYVPGPTDEFVIVANDGVDPVIGIFNGLPGGSLVGGSFKIFYNAGDGNDVVLKPALVTNLYVDDAWSAFAPLTFIADADLESAGAQPAIFGYDAFATLTLGFANVTASGTVNVNDGAYAADAVTVGPTQTLQLLGVAAATPSSVAIGSLAGAGVVDLSLFALANTLTVGALNTTTSYAGQITGAGALTKVGNGTLTLTNATSSFTGAVNVNGGTLATADVANIGVNSPLGAGSAINVGAGTLDFTAAASDSTNRPVSLTNAASVIAVSAGAGALALSAGLAGTGALTKAGPATLTLTVNSTYAGATTIAAGTLSVTSGDGVPNGSALLVQAAGTLSLGAAESVGPMTLETGTGDGADVTLGANALTLLADPSVVVTGTGAVGAAITGVASSSLNLNGAAPRTFTVGNGAAAIDLAVSTNVTNGAVTKAGPGTMQFAGALANTYAGATVVSDGTLSLAKSAGTTSIGAAPVTVGDGVGGAASAILSVDANEQIVDALAVALGGADGQFLISSGVTETVAPVNADFKGGDVRIAGTLVVGAGSYVQGPGVAGTTTLAGGTLRVLPSGLGLYTLNQGTLQGTGTVVVTTLTNLATIDPGIGSTSAGQITVLGNIDLQSTSVVALHVGGNLPGQFDQLNAGLNLAISPAAINVTNGTVQFRGTLNTGPIGAYIAPVGSFYDVMNFETRMLDTVNSNHLRTPSDFGTKNLGGAPWFDASFLSATNQLNAESYNSTTFGLLGNPPPTVGLAKKLRLTTLAAGPSLANDKTAATVLTKGGFTTNSTIRHQYQYVTVKNNSLLPINGPIYLEVTPSLAGVKLYNRAGVTLTAPGGKEYLVVTMSGLAPGATATVQLDWLNPNLLTFTYTHRVLAGGLP